MKITCVEFENNEKIPSKFTCDGENINPELNISDVPNEAKTLVLIMDDPDIPKEIKEKMNIEVFDHWVVFNISPDTTKIEEGSKLGVTGVNGLGKSAYTGPCPPKEYQPTEHRYFFKLYALDTELNLPEGSTKNEVEIAMQGHIIQETNLIGKYERN